MLSQYLLVSSSPYVVQLFSCVVYGSVDVCVGEVKCFPVFCWLAVLVAIIVVVFATVYVVRYSWVFISLDGYFLFH